MTRGKQKIEAQKRNAEKNQKQKGSQFEARAVALKITCPICKVYTAPTYLSYHLHLVIIIIMIFLVFFFPAFFLLCSNLVMMIDDEFLVLRNQPINPISFFVLFYDIYILEPS